MVMSKAGSEVILKCLLGREDEIDIEALPWGPEDEKNPLGIETVIEASMIRPAPGRILEEVVIKRESGGTERVILDHVGDGIDGGDAQVVDIKEEPVD